MAIGIENYQNVDTSNPAAYPAGQIKDDPAGLNGTPINLTTIGDYVQFFWKMLDASGETANNTLDNELTINQYFTAFKKLVIGNALALDPEGAWINGGSLTPTTVGGGSISVGSVSNHYKIIGKTMFWTFSLNACTVGGTVSAINVPLPTGLVMSLPILGSSKYLGFKNDVANIFAVRNGGAGLQLYVSGGGNFPTGTADQYYEFNIVSPIS